MNVIEKLLDRELFIDPDEFSELSDQQLIQLNKQIDDMSNEQIKTFIQKGTVEIMRSYTKKPAKRKYQDFVAHFNNRLHALTKILKQRQGLTSPQSISRIQPNEKVCVIGLVWDKTTTKNNHIILTIEDKSGIIKVLVPKSKPELVELAKDIMLDEVIGITGRSGTDIIFADDILIPDIPLSHELKKAPDEAYAVFLSDLHFGGKNFFEKEFMTFLKWLNGEVGSQIHKRVSSKIKYVFIAGDLIEGVGIYPNQEKDLKILDVKEQYKEFAKFMRMIPPHIQIIICPGNHDAGRLAEPQYNLYADFTEDVLNMPNMHLVSNPGWVRFHKRKTFPGFVTLLYHGYSFIYYGNNVPSIFEGGGVNNPNNIMKYLLQRRHLAPTHTSNLYIPDLIEDPLVIHEVPDFFVSGHIHMASADNYRGVTMLNCSCWVPITDHQRSYGVYPDPGKVALVNLKTRKIKFISFKKEDSDE